MAGCAAGARFVKRRKPVCRAYGAAACETQLVRARRQAVPDGDTLVEYEALALPPAFFFSHMLQIGENPALEVIDIV
jgi:hypothetical protein